MSDANSEPQKASLPWSLFGVAISLSGIYIIFSPEIDIVLGVILSVAGVGFIAYELFRLKRYSEQDERRS